MQQDQAVKVSKGVREMLDEMIANISPRPTRKSLLEAIVGEAYAEMVEAGKIRRAVVEGQGE